MARPMASIVDIDSTTFSCQPKSVSVPTVLDKVNVMVTSENKVTTMFRVVNNRITKKTVSVIKQDLTVPLSRLF